MRMLEILFTKILTYLTVLITISANPGLTQNTNSITTVTVHDTIQRTLTSTLYNSKSCNTLPLCSNVRWGQSPNSQVTDASLTNNSSASSTSGVTWISSLPCTLELLCSQGSTGTTNSSIDSTTGGATSGATGGTKGGISTSGVSTGATTGETASRPSSRTASGISSATSAVLSSEPFILTGTGSLARHIAQFAIDGSVIIALPGTEAGAKNATLQLMADGSLHSISPPGEGVYLRSSSNEARQILHALLSEIPASSVQRTFYFDGYSGHRRRRRDGIPLNGNLGLRYAEETYLFYRATRSANDDVFDVFMVQQGATSIPGSLTKVFLTTRGVFSSTTSSTTGGSSDSRGSTYRPSSVVSTSGSDNSLLSSTSSLSPSSSPIDSPAPSLEAAYDVITSLGYQSFCSELLSYTEILSTLTVVTETVSLASSTSISTLTSYTATESPTEYISTTTTTSTSRTILSYTLQRRNIATPTSLRQYPSAILQSACSMAVTSPAPSSIILSMDSTSYYLSETISTIHGITTSTFTSSATLTQSSSTLYTVPGIGYPRMLDNVGTLQNRGFGVSTFSLQQTLVDSPLLFELEWNATAQAYFLWSMYHDTFGTDTEAKKHYHCLTSISGSTRAVLMSGLWAVPDSTWIPVLFDYDDVSGALTPSANNFRGRTKMWTCQFTPTAQWNFLYAVPGTDDGLFVSGQGVTCYTVTRLAIRRG
ncbi:hypothetical protein TWF281_007447 [Arthrobotrys megalospora]